MRALIVISQAVLLYKDNKIVMSFKDRKVPEVTSLSSMSEEEIISIRKKIKYLLREDIKDTYARIQEEEWKRLEENDPTLFPKIIYSRVKRKGV